MRHNPSQQKRKRNRLLIGLILGVGVLLYLTILLLWRSKVKPPPLATGEGTEPHANANGEPFSPNQAQGTQDDGVGSPLDGSLAASGGPGQKEHKKNVNFATRTTLNGEAQLLEVKFATEPAWIKPADAQPHSTSDESELSEGSASSAVSNVNIGFGLDECRAESKTNQTLLAAANKNKPYSWFVDCPTVTTVQCKTREHPKKSKQSPETDSKRSKADPRGRALVLYMLKVTDQEFDSYPAWSQLAFFFKHGLIAPNVSTAMFAGVDFVFLRQSPMVRSPTLCAEVENTRFYWLPRVPCEACAFTIVLKALGFDSEGTLADWPYRQLILLTSDVRGPFVSVAQNETTWVDIAAMAGERSRAAFLEDDTRFTVLGTGFLRTKPNCDIGCMHPQLTFLSVPRALMILIYNALATGCEAESILICTYSVELLIGRELYRRNYGMYSFGEKFLLSKKGGTEVAQKALQVFDSYLEGGQGATRLWDPCRLMFSLHVHSRIGFQHDPNLQGVAPARRASLFLAKANRHEPIDLFAKWPSSCRWMN